MSSENGTRLLTREEIQRADDLPHTDVPTPEWGEGTAVRVRQMTLDQRRALGAAVADASDVNVSDTLLAFTIVGPDGQPLYTKDTVRELGAKNAAVVMRLAAASAELNNPMSEARVKNSERGQSSATSSGSPSGSA